MKEKLDFNKVNNRLVGVIIAVALLYVTVQVFVTSNVGTKSEEIDHVRTEKAQLRLENEILTSKIDQAKSLEVAKDIANEVKLENKEVNFLIEQNKNDVALNE